MVAVYDLDSMNPMDDPIVFMNNSIANELSANIKDKIQKLARKVDIAELKSVRKSYSRSTQENILDALGIEKGHMISLTEIDLNQKVKTRAINENKKEKKEGEKLNKKEKLATTKDIKIKQDLKMNAMATDMKTVGQILKRAGKLPKIQGKTFTKLGIVESDRVKDIDKKAKRNTTRFSFIAIASDGTVVPVNLEQDHQEGNNPREISYNTRAYGQVEQDDVNSRYRVGNGGETLSIKFSNGPGNIEVGYSSHKTIGGEGASGNISMDTQLETRTVYWKPRTQQRQSEFRGYRQAEDKYQEARKEGETDIKDLKVGDKGTSSKATYKETDGRKDTKSHEHEDDDEGRVPWDRQGRDR